MEDDISVTEVPQNHAFGLSDLEHRIENELHNIKDELSKQQVQEIHQATTTEILKKQLKIANEEINRLKSPLDIAKVDVNLESLEKSDVTPDYGRKAENTDNSGSATVIRVSAPEDEALHKWETYINFYNDSSKFSNSTLIETQTSKFKNLKAVRKHNEKDIEKEITKVKDEVANEIEHMGVTVENMKRSFTDVEFSRELDERLKKDVKERKDELDDVSFYEEMRKMVETTIDEAIPSEIIGKPLPKKLDKTSSTPTRAENPKPPPTKPESQKKRVSIQVKEAAKNKNNQVPAKINIPNSNLIQTPIYQNIDPYSQYTVTQQRNVSPTKKLSQLWNGVSKAVASTLTSRKPSGNERFLSSMSKEIISSPAMMGSPAKTRSPGPPKNIIKKSSELIESDSSDYDSDETGNSESKSGSDGGDAPKGKSVTSLKPPKNLVDLPSISSPKDESARKPQKSDMNVIEELYD